MPAYFDTGFSVRQVPWHGMGMIADTYPDSWEQAREWAGLMWEPEIRDVYVDLPADVLVSDVLPADDDDVSDEATINGESITLSQGDIVTLPDGRRLARVPTHRIVLRPDNGTILTRKLLSKDFSLITHESMGGIIETILGQPNVKFETAGSVKGGAAVWCLAYIDEPYTLPNDDTESYPFLALLNYHNGEGAAKVVATQVRVVCWNTIQMADEEGQRTGRQYEIRHVGDVAARVAEVKAALAGVRDEAKEWVALATDLFGCPVDDVQLNHFLSEFIPMPEADTISDRVRGNIDKARQIYRHLYADSLTTDAHKGTALGLVDAAVEYLDHVRGYRSSDTYLGRTMLRPEPLKAKAIAIARRVVQ